MSRKGNDISRRKSTPKLRMRKKDEEALRKAVKNFNAKLARLEKADSSVALPNKVTVKTLRASVETRAEFNELLSDLRKFTVRGAEKPHELKDGTEITSWEYHRAEDYKNRVNRYKAKKRKEIEAQEVKVGGKGQKKTRAEMGKIKENSLKPFEKEIDTMSGKDFKAFMKGADKILNAQERRQGLIEMRENYLKGLQQSGILDTKPIIKDYVESLPLDKFLETIETDETGSFGFIYEPQELKAKAELITDTWKTAHDEAIQNK